MGDGLKRAFAAAARTRADASLTPEMRRFLEALSQFDRPIQSPRLSVPAGGAQCYARRKCRDHGLAARVLADGRTRWQITPLGRQMLEAAPSPLAAEGKSEATDA